MTNPQNAFVDCLFSARKKDETKFKEKEIYQTRAIEGEFMNVIEEIQLEGKLKDKLEAASKMLGKGFSLIDILEITSLTDSDLKEKGLI